MKLAVDPKNFVDAIAWATRNYDPKIEGAYVALTVNEDGRCSLSHANLNSYMKGEFSASSVAFEDGEEGTLTYALEGRFLQRLGGAISGDKPISITKSSKSPKTSLEVKTAQGKFTVPLLRVTVPEAPKTFSLGEVDDNEFFDTLLRVAKLCDPANTGSNSFLGTVDIGFEDGIRLFATDRYAMSEVVLGFAPEDEKEANRFMSEHVLLPHSAAVLVPPTKGVNSSITLVGESGITTRFGYSFPDGRLALFSLSNAAGLPAKRIVTMKEQMRGDVEHRITVPSSEFASAIRVVSSLTWDEEHIFVEIGPEGLVVSDTNSTNRIKVGHSNIELQTDEVIRAKFSRPVLAEVFHPVTTKEVSVQWGDTSKSFMFVPVTDEGEEVEDVFIMAVMSRVDG